MASAASSTPPRAPAPPPLPPAAGTCAGKKASTLAKKIISRGRPATPARPVDGRVPAKLDYL